MRAALVLALLMATPAAAQDDDRGYLTALLEDNLSGAGRDVTITGFAGALSSAATIESLTIADDEGIWITLNGVVLDWSRSALLSGQVEVSELSAREIILERMPVAGDTAPSPEAGGFALPDLPVSVNIGRLAADRIVLGEPILGEVVEGRLDASMSLAGGEGLPPRVRADLTLEWPTWSQAAYRSWYIEEELPELPRIDIEVVRQGLAWLERGAGALFVGFGLRLAFSDNPTR